MKYWTPILILLSLINSVNAQEIGCTNPIACNFNLFATQDDGSCIFPSESSQTISSCNVFEWNGNSYSNSGIYSYVTENAAGCDSTAILNLTIHNAPIINFEKQDILCFGGSDGLIDLSVISNESELSYLWDTGQNQEDIADLGPGTYSVLVTDINSCSSEQTITITEPNLIESYQSIELCSGEMLSVGNSLYSITGNYIDTLLNVNNCDSIVYSELTVFNPLTSGSIGNSQEICFGDSPDIHQFITPPSGADGNYTYLWEQSLDGINFSQANWVNNNSSYLSQSLTQSTYYRVNVTSDFGCGSLTTNTIKDSVYQQMTAPIISEEQSICYNTTPQALNMIAPATGGGDISYIYQWQESADGLQWEDIDDFDTTLQPESLSNSTYYRLSARSNFNCGPVFSEPVFIEVYEPLNSGTISNNQNICFDTPASELEFDINPSGADGNYSFLWQQSQDSFVYQSANQENSQTNYQSENLTQSTYYRVKVTSNYGCGITYTEPIFINVFAPLTSGSIGNSQEICFGDSPDIHQFITPPSGADGNYTYLWEQSLDGINFSQANWVNNNSSYLSQSLTQSTYYRVNVTSDFGCGSLTTNTIKDSVYQQMTAPIISEEQSICYNTTPQALNMIAPATGGGDISYIYQWQESADGLQWEDIDDFDTTLQPESLSNSTYYRLSARSNFNCGPVFSEPVFIEVYEPLNSGTISNNQNICFDTPASELEFDINPSGADGNYSFLWQQSQDSFVYQSANQENSQTNYQSENLTQSTYYRVKVTSNYGCGITYTEPIFINVFAPLTSGSIGNSQEICFGDSPDIHQFITPPSGADGNYTYLWEQSLDGINFSQANWVNNNSSYLSQSLTQSTYYRVNVTSDFGCGSLTTNTIKDSVYQQMTAPIISEEQSICYNTTPQALNMIAPATGGGDISYIYQWQESADGLQWEDIDDFDTTLQPESLSNSTYYRLSARSNFNCGPVFSEPVFIEVYEPLNSGTISNNQNICFDTPASELEFDINPSGADGNYSFLWQQSQDSFVYQSANQENSQTNYQSENLTQSTYYRVKVTSNYGCGITYTEPIFINVYDEFLPGTISSNDTICFGETPLIINSLTIATGANSDYSFQWYESYDNGSSFEEITVQSINRFNLAYCMILPIIN